MCPCHLGIIAGNLLNYKYSMVTFKLNILVWNNKKGTDVNAIRVMYRCMCFISLPVQCTIIISKSYALCFQFEHRYLGQSQFSCGKASCTAHRKGWFIFYTYTGFQLTITTVNFTLQHLQHINHHTVFYSILHPSNIPILLSSSNLCTSQKIVCLPNEFPTT